MAYSKPSLDLLDEVHRIAHSDNASIDEDALAPVMDILRELLNAKTTVKGFAHDNNMSEAKVRAHIGRKATFRPKRVALWSYSYLKSITAKKSVTGN